MHDVKLAATWNSFASVPEPFNSTWKNIDFDDLARHGE